MTYDVTVSTLTVPGLTPSTTYYLRAGALNWELVPNYAFVASTATINVAGPTVPTPLLAASAACWRDEAHVAANRAGYLEKMAAAERLLGNRMTRPGGGFFLWLDVGNGEDFALKAWREQGIRLLPGATMGREIFTGKTQSNPGFSYVRVALVNDLSTIMTALERLREIL